MRRPPSEKLKWTPEAIAIEAKRYRSRTEFFNGSKGAYCAARDRGLLNQVCSHMLRRATTESPPRHASSATTTTVTTTPASPPIIPTLASSASIMPAAAPS